MEMYLVVKMQTKIRVRVQIRNLRILVSLIDSRFCLKVQKKARKYMKFMGNKV